MLLVDNGGSQCDLVLRDDGDLAIVLTQPLAEGWAPMSDGLSKYASEFFDRLNGVYVVHPEQVPEGKRPKVADMRKGWGRVLRHISSFGPSVKRVLLMCDTNMLKVAVPGLAKHGDLGDCHGTIFTLDGGLEMVPTWAPEELKHTQQWRDRDKARFLKLTKPSAPLPYITEIPEWLLLVNCGSKEMLLDYAQIAASIRCTETRSDAKTVSLQQELEQLNTEVMTGIRNGDLGFVNECLSAMEMLVPAVVKPLMSSYAWTIRTMMGLKNAASLEQDRQSSWSSLISCLNLGTIFKSSATTATAQKLTMEHVHTLVIDIETTGLDSSKDSITALGIQWSPTERAVLTGNNIPAALWLISKANIANISGHNFQYDLGFMGAPFRTAVFGRVRDTIVRARSRGELVASLKHLAVTYTASPGNYAWVGSEQHSFNDPKYLCEDLDTTWRLYQLWRGDDTKEVVKLFDEAVVMAADQTANGTFVDLEFLTKLAAETALDVERMRAELTAKYGVDPNQQQEMTRVLRERGYPLSKKTASGEDALTAEVLEELGLMDILEYRKAMKLDSAFVSKMRGFVRNDGTVPHHQTMLGAKTGRTTMKDFNWQQLPKKGPGKKLVRSRWSGGKIVNCDLTQAEVRVACWASGDLVLAKALLGPDMHRANAARGFDKSFDEVDEDERFQAKALIFRSIFGGGPTNDQQKRVHAYMVGEFRDLFRWIERQKKLGQTEYRVVDLLSKVTNMLDKLDYRGKWACGRLGINAPVQGTSSHVAIWLTLRVWKLFRELGMRSLVLFGVHDSFVIDAHPDEVQAVLAVIAQAFRDLGRSIFRELFPLMDKLPMGGDVQVGDTWAACKDAPVLKVYSTQLAEEVPF